MEEMRYLTFALGKGRLAKKTLEMFEQIGITCEEMKDKDTRKLIFVNEELKLRFFLAKGPDVPTYVEYGAADIGIVGKDTILEATAIQTYYQPFSFDSEKENSEFQIVQILGNFEYKYGFEYNSNCIVTEWLYRKNLQTKRSSTVFERTTEKVEFGSCVRKECEVYKEQIPVETLVLTFFNKLKLKSNIFKIVYSGVMDTLVVPTDFCEDTRLLEALLPRLIDEEKSALVEFLSAIDTGIKDIDYDDSEKEVKFTTYHKGKDGELHPLDLFFESEGTIKSIMLFIYARTAILYNKSIFVDELNIKLHPLLLKFIIDLFYEN